MKYAVEIGSGGMTYIPSFINTGSGIQKLIVGIHTHTHRTVISFACFDFLKMRKVTKNPLRSTRSPV
jgi:hypothetical protein